jgi:alkyl hydroperoxide reductase subunit AhpC
VLGAIVIVIGLGLYAYFGDPAGGNSNAPNGLYMIDPDGMLRYSRVHDSNSGRNTKETLRVLQALQTGEQCPVDWVPGEATLG